MPRGDATGPMGFGPMTGRGAGPCGAYGLAGYANPFVGQRPAGRFFGGGRGRGYRHWFHLTGLPGWARAANAPFWGVTPPAYSGVEQEKQVLRTQAEHLRATLKDLEDRLNELDSTQPEEGK
jgi:hypothetical protein